VFLDSLFGKDSAIVGSAMRADAGSTAAVATCGAVGDGDDLSIVIAALLNKSYCSIVYEDLRHLQQCGFIQTATCQSSCCCHTLGVACGADG
jgi:hypothetical protein